MTSLRDLRLRPVWNQFLRNYFSFIIKQNTKRPWSRLFFCNTLNSPESFLSYFNDTVERFNASNKPVYIAGDFNIDLLKSESCNYAHNFLLSLQSYSLIHNTRDYFPATIPRHAKISQASTTITINVIVELARDILASFGKSSSVIRIHDIQKCTVAWWFETKENYNEDNKQREWKQAQYFPELTLKISSLKVFQFIWNSGITLNMD